MDVSFFSVNPLYRKYLVEDQLFNVYSQVSGPVLNERVPGSDPTNENISNFMNSLGYINNGTVVKYITSNLKINPFLGILFNRETPDPARSFLLSNAFIDDGFTRQEFSGELILADPPAGVSEFGIGLLRNAEACKGKIVVYVEIEEEFGFNDEIIYKQAVEAGAIGVILVSEVTIPQFEFGLAIPDGPINNIMIYASSLSIGNALIGYNGTGNRNDPASYQLSTGPNSGYTGNFEIAQSLGRVIGSPALEFGIVKSEFSDDKNIGYIFFQNVTFSDVTETNPIFWEEYGKSTIIDQYAKMFAAILSTEITTPSGIKRFSEMDSIVIDNSNNTGGFDEVIMAFASFFGENRQNLDLISSSTGTGFSASTTLPQLASNLPPPRSVRLQYWNRTENLECDNYQTIYPLAAVKSQKVVILTSTAAFSAGDIFSHYFRDARKSNFGDLGTTKSILIGNIDGRIQGFGSFFPKLSAKSRTSILSFIPSVMGITAPIMAYQITGENLSTLYNTFTNKPLTSQLPEIKIDGLDNQGPIAAWFEDEGGLFQAFGFSEVYERGQDSRYNRFKTISERPIPYNQDTYHNPFTEDAILAATRK
jgi:hypothetical protein